MISKQCELETRLEKLKLELKRVKEIYQEQKVRIDTLVELAQNERREHTRIMDELVIEMKQVDRELLNMQRSK